MSNSSEKCGSQGLEKRMPSREQCSPKDNTNDCVAALAVAQAAARRPSTASCQSCASEEDYLVLKGKGLESMTPGGPISRSKRVCLPSGLKALKKFWPPLQ
mmetsp:Transcript_64093/g.139429  ORF Transcript_64093/g.139429 Transcript_64093/m.139429 type:complete len:101 (-) Transcript_64093:205-507(-)